MIYDFVDDSNLDNEVKIKFKNILLSNSYNFSEYLSHFSNKYKENIDWWVSLPASRNNFTSELYYNFCICEFIKQEIAYKKKITKILVKSKQNAIILKKILKINNLNSKVEIASNNKIYKLKKNHSYISINFINIFIINLYYQIYKIILSLLTKKFKKKNFSKNQPLTLIDTFILPKFVNVDRYYNNLTTDIFEDKENIFFIPTIVTTNIQEKKNLYKTYKELRLSNKNYIIKEDYLSLFDIFYALFHFFRVLKIKKYNHEYNNTDYSELIYEELISVKGFGMSIEALLNYRFVKKLKQNETNIKYFINWWENQPLDKSLNFSLNKYYKNVPVVGYLGYVPRNLEINLFPFENEVISGVIPKTIAVIGEGYIELIKKFTKNIDVFVFPALRFDHLWESKLSVKQNNKTIVVALPILLKESIEILETLIKVNFLDDNKKQIKVLIKSHPAVDKHILINHFNYPSNFEFVDKNTIDLMYNSDLMISGISSICLESICIGLPLIIIEKDKCLNFDPIPQEIDNNIYHRVNDDKELNKSINFFLNLSKQENEILKLNASKIKNYYFEKPTKENKQQMLKIN